MYWNALCIRTCNLDIGLIETWDVLKSTIVGKIQVVEQFNRNMGCIEMMNYRAKQPQAASLIETWDVLKSEKKDSPSLMALCLIETWDVLKFGYCGRWRLWIYQFNRNMGCIEIKIRMRASRSRQGLIETWDVLKYKIGNKDLQKLLKVLICNFVFEYIPCLY